MSVQPVSIRAALCLALMAAFAAPAPASASGKAGKSFNSNDLCGNIILRTEWRRGIPARLLGAISIAESGRFDRRSRATIAWPWTVNAGGDARYYGTKKQAIAGVRQLKARGVRNIDVGCMQVNLMHHPKAFANLEAAFDPATNVAYAAHYLKKLHGKTGSWVKAVASYHSSVLRRGHPYMLRVLKIWVKRPGTTRPTQLANARANRQVAAKPRPTGKTRQARRPSASLVRRVNIERTAKAKRKWAEVLVRRKRFAEWLTRRQAERRAKRDPS